MQWLRDVWSLIKSKQTALLLFTGVAGCASGGGPLRGGWPALLGALLLSISGATVLNMVYDRDIDGKMARTQDRPLPAGRLSPGAALALGAALTAGGLAWAFAADLLFGLIVFAGWLLDVGVYTVWLKRRTPWSILWGGISGGMPVLAGRALALGRVDLVGLLLALAVLLWIPTHILTFSIKYAEDYAAAGVPVFPNVYGPEVTQRVISGSTLLAALTMATVTWLLSLPWGTVGVSFCLGAVLVGLAANALIRPSVQVNFRLFKFASLYMVAVMAIITVH